MEIVRSNRGAVLVLVALFLFLFFAFIGLATDSGWAVYVRSQGQARVDAAALAAASALVSPDAVTRQADATSRANTFSDQNSVVQAGVDPTNDVDPMFYNYTTHTLSEAASWVPANCNAVRVTNTVPTPLFFSRIREVFGGAPETCTNTDGSAGDNCMNNTVSAVGYLGCPNGAKPQLPLALCAQYVDYPDKCGVVDAFQVPSAGNSAFTDFNTNYNCQQLVKDPSLIPFIDAGEAIRIINGQIDSCMKEIEKQYLGKCVLIPVIECPSGQLNQSAPVEGFAELCITQVTTTGSDKKVVGTLDCTKNFPAGSGGECFGVSATNPILVQ